MWQNFKLGLHDAYYSKGNIPVLDGFRGIAAFLVLISHIFQNQFKHIPVLDAFIFTAGHNGVNLFFVLSGFLISFPFWERMRFEGSEISYRNYYIKRGLRVLPLFYISTALFIVLSIIVNGDLLRHIKIIPFYFFQVHNFFAQVNFVNPPSWTIAVELHFYLLLSLFFLWVRKDTIKIACLKLGAVLVMLFAYKLYAFYLVQHGGSFRNLLYANSFARLDQFIIGMFLSLLLVLMSMNIQISERLSKFRPLIFSGGIALIVLVVWKEYNADKLGLTKHDLFVSTGAWITASLGSALLMLSGILHFGPVKNFFSLNILAFLGKISFSLYLLHQPLYIQLYKGFFLQNLSQNETLCAVSYIFFIIPLSYLSYAIIERPFLGIKLRFAQA